MRRHAADDPELLVPPPLLDAHPAPPHLQDARREDGHEERDEEQAGERANLQMMTFTHIAGCQGLCQRSNRWLSFGRRRRWHTDRRHDELAGEEAYGGEGTVGEQRERGERVDGGVDVGEALQPLEVAVLVAVQQRAVAAEEDLDGPQRPPEHLVETVG